jgi:hypothetical protein
MKHLFLPSLAGVTALLATGALAATPTAASSRLLDSVSARVSMTAAADLRRGAGEVEVQHYEFQAGGRTVTSGGGIFVHGISFGFTELDAPPAGLLPERLRQTALDLAWQQALGPEWRLMLSLRPGFYATGSSLDGEAFNAPLLALASYASSRELVWSFGLVANAFSDNPVLPVAGVRWQFAPDWTFNLGLPRTGVAWEISKTATLSLGATVQGGAYKVTRGPVGAVGALATQLRDTEFDYREARVGVGGDFKLNDVLSLSVDVGATVDQRFDYHERGIEQRGETAAFGAIAINARF